MSARWGGEYHEEVPGERGLVHAKRLAVESANDAAERKGARRDKLESVGMEVLFEASVQHAGAANGHVAASVADGPRMKVGKQNGLVGCLHGAGHGGHKGVRRGGGSKTGALSRSYLREREVCRRGRRVRSSGRKRSEQAGADRATGVAVEPYQSMSDGRARWALRDAVHVPVVRRLGLGRWWRELALLGVQRVEWNSKGGSPRSAPST